MIERSFKKEAFEKCKSNSELTEEQLQSDNAVDLVPKGYSFARRFNPGIVKRVTVIFMIDGDKEEPLQATCIVPKNIIVQCLTAWDSVTGQMKFGLDVDCLPCAATFASPRQAYDDLKVRHSITTHRNAYHFFGFPCFALQTILFARRSRFLTIHNPVNPRPRATRTLARQTLKQTANNITDISTPGVDMSIAPMFGLRSVQSTVEKMIEVLEETLIIRRQPEYRAQAVLEQFLDHPDLKKVIAGLNQSHWGWNLKSQRAVQGVIVRLTEAIQAHKL